MSNTKAREGKPAHSIKIDIFVYVVVRGVEAYPKKDNPYLRQPCLLEGMVDRHFGNEFATMNHRQVYRACGRMAAMGIPKTYFVDDCGNWHDRASPPLSCAIPVQGRQGGFPGRQPSQSSNKSSTRLAA